MFLPSRRTEDQVVVVIDDSSDDNVTFVSGTLPPSNAGEGATQPDPVLGPVQERSPPWNYSQEPPPTQPRRYPPRARMARDRAAKQKASLSSPGGPLSSGRNAGTKCTGRKVRISARIEAGEGSDE